MGRSQLPLEPSPLQAAQPQLSQPILIGEVFHPLGQFCGIPLDAPKQVHVSPVLRTPHPDKALQVSSHSAELRGQSALGTELQHQL